MEEREGVRTAHLRQMMILDQLGGALKYGVWSSGRMRALNEIEDSRYS